MSDREFSDRVETVHPSPVIPLVDNEEVDSSNPMPVEETGIDLNEQKILSSLTLIDARLERIEFFLRGLAS